MDDPTRHALFEALHSEDPGAALTRLAREMKALGKDQGEIYDIFTLFLDELNIAEPGVPHDALIEVMDRIIGWSSPDQRLFDDYLES